MSKSLIYSVGSILLVGLVVASIVGLVGASPVAVMASLWNGALGNGDRVGRCLATLVPLVLCSSGLVFTFTAGLYNLGVEGQITAGAIATTFVLRLGQDNLPPSGLIPLAIVVGGLGGILWGLLAGWLNVYGRINEIFAGLGLNFVADGLALYLIFGPWQREGVASMSGTELFDPTLRLSTIGKTAASPLALAIAALALGWTIVVLQGTYFGLKLKAVGQNLRAAYVLGIPSVRQLLSAFLLCGAMAGIAGSLQVLALFHRLIPNISSNLGYLSLLIVMLVNHNPWFILPVALFFSLLNVGSLQLPLALNLESSLAGVIQGLLVLSVLLARGLAGRESIPKT